MSLNTTLWKWNQIQTRCFMLCTAQFSFWDGSYNVPILRLCNDLQVFIFYHDMRWALLVTLSWLCELWSCGSQKDLIFIMIGFVSLFKMVSTNGTIKGCRNLDGWVSAWMCTRAHTFSYSHVARWYIWSLCDFWTVWVSLGVGVVVCNV